MCGIYKITNKVNGKIYIGKSIDIERRWWEHRKSPFWNDTEKYNTYFYNAIRKYGIDNFELSIIEETEKENLNNLEKYWIAFYHSNDNKYGYNTTDGGDGVIGYWDKEVCAYDLDGNFIQKFKSASEAGRQLSVFSTGINKCCRHKQRSAGGYQWRYADEDNPDTYYNGHITSPVYQYDLDGNYINTFKSIADAERQLAISDISLCCNRVIKSAGGFQWSNIYYEKLDKVIKNHKTTPVYQYNLNGDFIQEFQSIKDASDKTNISYANIASCIHSNTQIKAGDFLWTCVKKSCIKPYHNKHCKQVNCFTKQGILINSYISIREAAISTRTSEYNINSCCRGKRKSAGGYIWKYA